ncbi:hypothetical protein CEXT_499231 [Caerostris extrusa]|uniref:Ribosomal protein L2 n=1 Tax=Caerostris extrusa TaxID=172846 RepID=A0AAV4V6X4_CAEEX|nr:hypothetical protein CEXT_499231 [Caerostris extrusa]
MNHSSLRRSLNLSLLPLKLNLQKETPLSYKYIKYPSLHDKRLAGINFPSSFRLVTARPINVTPGRKGGKGGGGWAKRANGLSGPIKYLNEAEGQITALIV